MSTQVNPHKETLEFQAEVRQLLKLVINSLYSNKEIFLRELVSNASDASDKLRFEALTDDALYEGDGDLKIRVTYDRERRTITVSDNGIGMDRREVTENIGTIAKSGTRQFMEALTGEQAKDAKLIGQFGVGFYSAFIVADKVTLLSRRAGLAPEHGVMWESSGEGDYIIETVDRPRRGTDIILHLREGEDEFLDDSRLRTVLRKYSDHISLPIEMAGEGPGEKDRFEVVNRASALWVRPKSDIQDQEYKEFYKHIAHDFEDPLAYVHTHVEGRQSYTGLYYVPARAPFDLWERERHRGIKLYVRRVFITEDTEHLMPRYLRFVRGILDSDDLPLNISREMLQHNRMIDSMRAGSVKKVLGLLEQLAENDKEKYTILWREFGRVIKEGVVEDDANRDRIAKLLRFSSTLTDQDSQDTSLQEYIGRMKPEQEKIYYITAESFAAALHSPHLEILRNKGIEVLLMGDPIDEWLTAHLTEFEGKALQSAAKGDLGLGKLDDVEHQREMAQAADELSSLVDKIRGALGEKVKEVRVSQRLTKSPSCLVVEEHDMAVNLQRMLKAAGHHVPGLHPILEINPGHPLVKRLNDGDDAHFADWAHLLYEQALLSEGGQLEDPATFVRRMNDLFVAVTGGEDRGRIIL
jgi:molecular chaperone HtpG